MQKKPYLYGILLITILCLITGCKKNAISKNDIISVANNYNFKVDDTKDMNKLIKDIGY